MLINNDRAAYRVLATAGFFGPDCHLYGEGDVIYYDDTPNEEFEPLNDKARVALHAYLEELDRLGAEAAAKAGRAYAGRPRTLDDALAIASQDARRVQLVKGDGGVPLMGAKPRGRPRIERVDVGEDAPEDGRRAIRRGPASVAS